MNRSRRLSVVLIATIVLVATGARRADAQDKFFAFLIENGWQAAFEHPKSRPEVNLSSWGTGTGPASAAFAVVNGQKGPFVGGAAITIWARPAPDPFYASLGSIAGLIMLDVEGVRAHLSLFETPAGVRATVSLVGYDTNAATVATGTWFLGNGSSVVGGTANDLVVGGLVKFRPPQPVGLVDLLLLSVFMPFPNDWPPPFFETEHFTSVYSQQFGPLRLFTRRETIPPDVVRAAMLMLIHTGGDDYVVMACTHFGILATEPSNCTVSGTGSLSYLTGRMIGFGWQGIQFHIILKLFAALPI